MRVRGLIAAALLVSLVQAREAAACEVDEDGIEAEDCEEELAAFDEQFDQDVSVLDQIQLELAGIVILPSLVIHWTDDEDDQYVEYETDPDFDTDPDLETDPDLDNEAGPDFDNDFDDLDDEAGA